MDSYTYTSPYAAANAQPSERAAFIRQTYNHLSFAILGFILIEAIIFSIPGIDAKLATLMAGRASWGIVLLLFIGASWIANRWAQSDASRGKQYLGLIVYVLAEAIIFVPMLYVARMMTGDNSLILQAGIVTGLLFFGITAVAFITKKDFSFLGGFLAMAGFVALGVIVCSLIFGFTLGVIFSGIMCLVASGCILYTTSQIIHNYRTDQYVAASLALFASVALLFWYVLRIFMDRR